MRFILYRYTMSLLCGAYRILEFESHVYFPKFFLKQKLKSISVHLLRLSLSCILMKY